MKEVEEEEKNEEKEKKRLTPDIWLLPRHFWAPSLCFQSRTQLCSLTLDFLAPLQHGLLTPATPPHFLRPPTPHPHPSHPSL